MLGQTPRAGTGENACFVSFRRGGEAESAAVKVVGVQGVTETEPAAHLTPTLRANPVGDSQLASATAPPPPRSPTAKPRTPAQVASAWHCRRPGATTPTLACRRRFSAAEGSAGIRGARFCGGGAEGVL